MRLGIRRKLIGILMLVGLLPLVVSLIVILIGGATMRLRVIRDLYDDTATMCAARISNTLLHEELERLVMIARLPRVDAYVQAHSLPAPADGALPLPTADDKALDEKWPSLPDSDPAVDAILHNEASIRLTMLSEVDRHLRHIQIANTRGQLIVADSKTDNFFQAGEEWWRIAYDRGRGRLYISSITVSQGGKGKFSPGEHVVEIAVPIYITVDGKPALIGILKDELSVSWLLRTLHDLPAAKQLGVLTQLVDRKTGKPLFLAGDQAANESLAAKSLQFYLDHRDQPRISTTALLNQGLIVGSARVGITDDLDKSAAHLFADVAAPDWAVVIANNSNAALEPVYTLAAIVAVIGAALILVLFILGVVISNREFIIPILRLREATAAVGRGELNARVLTDDPRDRTFHKDELGQLAHDFDVMTRELQKSVHQLARSNEAKRRFMELAGHELRTPITYLLGACNLTQKQLESTASPDAAARNAAALAATLGRIAAKTQRLTRIIDNLLKLVNNDQFTTRMNKTLVDVRALILQVAADHRPFIAERRQQLEVDVSESLPPLEADRDKLEDVLSNLLTNAIRFSPDGATVRIAAHQVIGSLLEILVEDAGPGIPPEDLANLFEPFYTGLDIARHTSGTTEFGTRGIGLGLAIVRRFIELHGGIVRAKTMTLNGKTTGTQFQILLPLTKLEDAAPPRTESGSA
jgi:two-component system, OmpR family, sensor histidine kinase BaeS